MAQRTNVPAPLRVPVLRLARRLPVLIVTALTIFSTAARASFEELPTGARAAGMGDAFTAIADDAYSMYYNPSGLAQLHRSEFTAYYAKLYSGLTDNSNIARSYVAYAHPTATHGTFGISYLSLSLADLYTESSTGLSYAHSLGERWNLGGTMKLLHKSFGSDDYTQNAINSDTGVSLGAQDPLFAKNGTSKTGIGMDLGAQYRISKIYGIGMSALNINSPNMSLDSSDSDKVAPVFKLGLARHTKMSAIDAEIGMSKFTTDEEYRVNIGAERWFNGGFGLRAGLGFGQRGYQMTSLGFSYRWQAIDLAYALIYPLSGIQGTFGTNQLSLTFRFGRRQ